MGRQSGEGLRKDRSGIWLILAGLLLILGSRAGLGSSGTGDQRDISGQMARSNVTVAGSSSMESYVSALAEGFMECYPDITVTVQFTGSSAGIAAVAAGSVDIGISSRYLKEEEKAAGVTEYVVGLDGIALCGNPANGVSGITKEELCGIYTGEIRNWTELGGCDLPVVVVGREAGSGTRDAFEKLLGLEDRCAYANELDSTGAVMARILATPGAIGYVSFETVGRVQKEGTLEQGIESAGEGEVGAAAATKTGTVTKTETRATAEPGTAAETRATAEPGTAAETGATAEPGTAAEPGIAAETGATAESGTAAETRTTTKTETIAECKNDVITVLCLDGIEPSSENVRNGSYPLCRPFVMAVKGEITSQNSLVQRWFAYVESEAGRRIAEQAELVGFGESGSGY